MGRITACMTGTSPVPLEDRVGRMGMHPAPSVYEAALVRRDFFGFGQEVMAVAVVVMI